MTAQSRITIWKFKLDPKYATAFINRGNAYREKDDIVRAAEDYSGAIEADPTNAVAFNSRGGAYLMVGDLDHAVAYYNEAIRLQPRYALAFFNRGLACATRATSIAPLPTITRRSTSTRATSPRSSTAATSAGIRATSIVRLTDYDEGLRVIHAMHSPSMAAGMIRLKKGDLDGRSPTSTWRSL